MHSVTRDGVSIEYAFDGPGDGPTVLLLEGLGYGRWMWRWLTDALADEYEVIRPDNRGTGGSDVPEGPYTVAEMAADARAVLDDHGADRVHVCGASMGGMIAQELAVADDRVDRIVDWRLAGDTTPAGREAQAAAVAAFDATDQLGEIDVPTLILHGTDDRVLPVGNADLLADYLPHATVERVDGGPHLFFIERRDAVNPRIRSFLDEVA